MEDQENQEQKEQSVGQQIAEQGKQMAEQAIKDTAKQAGKQVGKVAGKAIIKLLYRVLMAALPYIIAVILVIVLALALYAVIDKVREIISTISSSISTFIVAGDNGPIAPSPEEMMNLINNELESAGIDKEDLYLGNSLQADLYLYKFMSASLGTQLPYIKDSTAKTMIDIASRVVIPGVNVWESIKDTFGEEVQGIVKIKRQTGDATTELTYKKHDDLVKLIEENKTKALEYFSIDEEWMLCVAKSTTTTTINPDGTTETETTLEEEKMPYQTIISQYTVPFEFFIALQQISQNAEYVSAVADLIQGGEIELTIFDSTQVVTTEYTYKYKIRKRWVEEREVPRQEYTGTVSSRSVSSLRENNTSNGMLLAATRNQTYNGSTFEDVRNQIISYLRGQGCTSNINVVRNGNSGVGWQNSSTRYTASIITQQINDNQWRGQVSITDTPISNGTGSTGSTGGTGGTTTGEQEGENPEEPETEIIQEQKDETSEEIVETKITTQEITSITATVTKADVWVIKQEATLKQGETTEYPLGEEGITNQLDPEATNEEIGATSAGEWKVERSENTKQTVVKEEIEIETNNVEIDESKFLGLWKNSWFGGYVSGASYDPDGSLVKYLLPNSLIRRESPVLNILSSEELLYEQLEKTENTQTHAQLMRYLIHFYKTGEKLDISELISIFSSIGYVEGSYTGRTRCT